MEEVRIFGSFYLQFINQLDLSGEYINNFRTSSVIENAIRVEEDEPNQFVGRYLTSWQEENSEVQEAELVITNIGDKFMLRWINESDRSTIFFGEGFLMNGILIGCYSNVAF